jgi:aspartate aminotransferase
MQYAVPDLENLSIDRAGLARKRDTVLRALAPAGYAIVPPEGTFYLWGKWPQGDPERLWNALADRKVFVMPGGVMASPDWFRISLTASESMIERALPHFLDVARGPG